MKVTRKQKILLVLTILFILFITNTSATHTRLLTVISGSMEPSLPTGTLIMVRPPGDKLFAPNDIITFRKDDILITHRIIDVGYDGNFYYVTQGDANSNPDPDPVRPQQVLGHVTFVMPSLLIAPVRALRTPSLLILFLLLLRLTWARFGRKLHINNTRREA